MTARRCFGQWSAALLLIAFLLPARGGSDLLEPEQAFRFSARWIAGRMIEVQYQVAEGYYLYKAKFAFHPDPASAVRLGDPQLPAGSWHEDEFFGRSEIYRGPVTIRIPVLGTAPRRFDLLAVSQGCADIGVCYLPTTHRASLFTLEHQGSEARP